MYAVRFTDNAEREALDAAARYGVLVDDQERGRAWYAGLKAAAGTLATDPRRLAVRERESRLLGLSARALLYRPTPTSRAAYLAFYAVEDESEDGPRVTILHVRHAARKPLTRAEAQDIEKGGEA